MEQLDEYMTAKRRIAAAYTRGVRRRAGPDADARGAVGRQRLLAVHRSLVDEARFGMASRDLLARLAAEQVQTRPLWQPMHRCPRIAGSRQRCPVADRLCRDGLSLPCSVGLGGQQARVIDAVRGLARGRRCEAA